MAPNPRLQDERLDALYATLPSLECKGYCWDCCDTIEMSIRERSRIERVHGEVRERSNGRCTMLTDDNRCSVHEIRPMLCRLWGMNEVQECPFGCKPSRMLTVREFGWYLREADRLGGMPSKDQKKRWTSPRHRATPAEVERAKALLREKMEGGEAQDAARNLR